MQGGMERKQVGEYITDLDIQKYLNYVVSTQALKGVPAFDSQIDGINNASGENEEFGDATGNSVNFTDYTAQKNNTTITDAIRRNVRLNEECLSTSTRCNAVDGLQPKKGKGEHDCSAKTVCKTTA